MHKFDLTVIGGGHVGLSLSADLASQGYSVALIEKKRQIGERVVCTGIIGHEAFKKFDLPTETVVGKIQNIRFFSPSGNSFDYDPPNSLADVVNRSEFNRFYREKALRLGVQIFTGYDAKKVIQKKECIHIRAFSEGENESIFESQMLILATGVNSRLFRSVGIRPPSEFLSGAQIHIPFDGEDRTLIFSSQEMAKGSFGWLVPLPNGIARVGLMTEKNPLVGMRILLDQVMPGWRDDIREKDIDIRPIIQNPLERSVSDRVMVVGEAAGQIKTTTGGGIYYGLLGAQAALEVIARAFKKNRFKADVLSSYDKKWKKLMSDELRFGNYLRKVYSKFSDEQICDLFDKVAEKDIVSLAYSKANFDWHSGFMNAFVKLPMIKKAIQSPF